MVEKLIERGRHIEVQIAGDGKGKVVHLFERECSLQRRHQKLIEEAPAAGIPARLRDRILADAVRLGERLHYRGVGTIEFIFSGDDYYFLEVNPRLQVEHPVTEMVTGIDIVEMMLRIATGEGLSFTQSEVSCDGHAVEARLCAEDPNDSFMPSTGKLAYVRFPATDVRVETGIESGSVVTPYYDPMLAKLITHARTRDEALDKLERALDETSIFGVATNRDFLKRLLGLPATRNATFHTRLIDEQIGRLIEPPMDRDREALTIAACFWMMRQRQPEATDPWQSLRTTGWQMTTGDEGLSPIPLLHLESTGASAEIRFAPLSADGSTIVGANNEKIPLKLTALDNDDFMVVAGPRHEIVHIHQQDGNIFVHDRRRLHTVTAIPYLTYVSATAETTAELRAPMTGLIAKVNVAVGDAIKTGDVAVVMESMKMELRIVSQIDGIVAAVHCRAGETTDRNAIVVTVEPTHRGGRNQSVP
jgi:3-methylcrotonyl-CoA carboxylase alpha subunit